jgi:hypothetical protein
LADFVPFSCGAPEVHKLAPHPVQSSVRLSSAPVPVTLEPAKGVFNGHNPGREEAMLESARRASADKSNQREINDRSIRTHGYTSHPNAPRHGHQAQQ